MEQGATCGTVAQVGVKGSRQPSYLSNTERPASRLGGGDQLCWGTGHIPVSTFFEDEHEEGEDEKESGERKENERESDESEGTSSEYEGVRYLISRRGNV